MSGKKELKPEQIHFVGNEYSPQLSIKNDGMTSFPNFPWSRFSFQRMGKKIVGILGKELKVPIFGYQKRGQDRSLV